jgi:hypothetical protein
VQLRNFVTEVRPLRFVVERNDVASTAVGDPLEHLFTRAVFHRECDECATRIVLTAFAKPEAFEIVVEAMECLVLAPVAPGA